MTLCSMPERRQGEQHQRAPRSCGLGAQNHHRQDVADHHEGGHLGHRVPPVASGGPPRPGPYPLTEPRAHSGVCLTCRVIGGRLRMARNCRYLVDCVKLGREVLMAYDCRYLVDCEKLDGKCYVCRQTRAPGSICRMT